MITLFENFNNPDLRRIGKYILCIKDYYYPTLPGHFTKDKYYKVRGFYGDPQGAIEKYGINDYLPVECIYRVVIFDDNNEEQNFKINVIKYLPAFFDYFEIPEFSDKIDKFNI